MKKTLILSVLIFTPPVFAHDLDNHKIAENFCYAIQAVGQCPELNMRLDTEGKVNKLLGAEVRVPNGVYSESCLNGLNKANNDKNLCENAWKRFGCQGAEFAQLIQQSPFGNPSAITCKFNK